MEPSEEKTSTDKNTEPRNPAGMILDGRYQVLRVIGEGGFGTTYEAVNLHNGQRTAVKEHKTGNFEKVLKEARILRDFADDPNIVTVLDAFSENGKAYMVMEYLDGTTLAEEIRKNGKWSTEKTVRIFSPVMDALARMHQAGVIHRDISPDNLMLMPGNKLVLMDFGAVKAFSENNYTQTPVYKSVYSPPEQRETGVTLGPYSDVYALCATIYFCITGTEPEDSLSRLLYDELKKPSEIGSDILPRAEKTLLKGLELLCEDRIPDAARLKLELEAVYPDLTEEERKAEAAAKKRRKNMLLAMGCVLLACVLAVLYCFRIRIRFSMIDTQKAMLSGEHLSSEAFAEHAAGVRERVEAFAGKDNYLWKENGRRILLEIPSELFEETDPSLFIRVNLTRENVLSVGIPDENIGPFVISQSADIARIESTDGKVTAAFTEAAAARFGDALKEQGKRLKLEFNADYSVPGFIWGVSNGDGTGFTLEDVDASDRLIMLLLTRDPLKNNFHVQVEWNVRWEDPEKSMFPGRNQFRAEEIPGRTITLRYKRGSGADSVSSGLDAGAINALAVMKNRLDSLDIPYAVGTDRYHKDCFVFRVPAESTAGEALTALGEYLQYKLTLGNRFALYDSNLIGSLDVIGVAEENLQITAHIKASYMDDCRNVLQTIRQQEGEKVFLYFKNAEIASAPLEKAFRSLDENGSIVFTEIRFASGSEVPAEKFASFLPAAMEQDPKDAYYLTDDQPEIRDDKGKIIWFAGEDLMPQHILDNSAQEKLAERIREEYKTDLRVIFDEDPDQRGLTLWFYGVDIIDPEAALKPFEALYRTFGPDLTDGRYKSIEVYFFAGEKYGLPCVNMSLKSDFGTAAVHLYDSSIFPAFMVYSADFTADEANALEDRYDAYVHGAPLWEPLLP